MRCLICLDDTDNLDSIGTGQVLENLCAALSEHQLGRGGFITRHQLLIHEDIAYTSHNSSMCCDVEVGELERTVAFCRSFLDTGCAEGSDPGLCVVNLDALENPERLIRFGKAAKTQVFRKRDALEAAARFPGSVYLSEHGGTGDGVIGALAGCGLRLFGYDGKIKGKLKPDPVRESMTVEELCRRYGLDMAMDRDRRVIPMSDTVVFREPGKAVHWAHRKAAYLDKEGSGAARWRMLAKNELTKELVD